MFNPADLFKVKSTWETFIANHPKFPMFVNAVGQQHAVKEGTVIEVHIKPPTGEDICTNVKLTQSDMELFEMLKSLM